MRFKLMIQLMFVFTFLVLNVVGIQKIAQGQVTATIDWPNPCCYAKHGSFSPTITICNGLSETITGNTTLEVSSYAYQNSIVYGPLSWNSGCSDLNMSWQIPVTAPIGAYDAMVTILPTSSLYFTPVVIQKSNAFVVNPSGSVI